jgi:hypothetical protein
MAIIKFNEDNKVLFGKIETVPGVYELGIAATDALAATAITGSVTFETGNFEYLGDSLSRDEFTFQKDSFADVTVETPQQVLNVLNPALTVADVPLGKYFRACGGNVTVNGTTGVVTITNSVAENSRLSFNFTKSSADDTVNYKLYKFFSMLGTVDLEASIGDVPRLKFAFKGNAIPPVTATLVAPNFSAQTTSVAGTIRQANIIQSQITPFGENFNAQSVIAGTPGITFVGTTATVTLTAHGLTTGRLVSVRGATGADGAYYNGDFAIIVLTANTFTYIMNGTPALAAAGTITVSKDGWAKSACFSTFTAPNFFGQELTRFLTGCEEGFDRKAVPSDVNMTILETHAPSFAIASITRSTITATVTTDAAHGLSTGNVVTIKGATDALYNGKFIITVLTGTTFTYVMGGTPSASAVATSVGALVLINESSTTFDPDINVTNFFAVQLKTGIGAGKFTTQSWSKLQLTNVKDGKVATSEGRDIAFRNTGNSSIIMS